VTLYISTFPNNKRQNHRHAQQSGDVIHYGRHP
jgi:hypothetical protein